MAGLIIWSFEGRLFSTLTHLLKKDFVTFRPFFKKMQFFFNFLHSQKGLQTFITQHCCGPLGAAEGPLGAARGRWGGCWIASFT